MARWFDSRLSVWQLSSGTDTDQAVEQKGNIRIAVQHVGQLVAVQKQQAARLHGDDGHLQAKRERERERER